MAKPKVLLGMSGGTDSSVAAMLLQDAGYEVEGITFRFYEEEGRTGYLDDARSLAASLGIRHWVCDARRQFREEIVGYFVREYMRGRTPVPCTMCNNRLKWPLLLRWADERGIPFVATGHYARTCRTGSCYHIMAGTDREKDQSFFLWGLSQEVLSRVVLPLGGLTKKEVRTLAGERGYGEVARKKDSMGICFCPGDYRTFLRREMPEGSFVPGFFVDGQGAVLGRHEGYPFYTIGQRRGLGLQLNKAVFVKDIFPEENRIVLGDKQSLDKCKLLLDDWRLTDPDEVLEQEDVIVKIRYRKQANRCRVACRPDGLLHVSLLEPLGGVACGQAAVFYRGGVVLGGGIICASEDALPAL